MPSLSNPAAAGQSGGPIYSPDGVVVGIFGADAMTKMSSMIFCKCLGSYPVDLALSAL